MGYRRVTLSAVNSVVTGRTSSADRPFLCCSRRLLPRGIPPARVSRALRPRGRTRVIPFFVHALRGAVPCFLRPGIIEFVHTRFSLPCRALSTRSPFSSCRCQVPSDRPRNRGRKMARRANDKRRAICGKGATVVRPVHMCARKHVAESRVRRSKARTPETQFKPKEKERRRRRRRRHSGLSYYTLGGPG